MDPQDYDTIHITQGDIVTVRTAGFQKILNSKSQARALTLPSELVPLPADLLDQVAKDAVIEEHSILGIGHRHLVSSAPAAETTSARQAPAPPKPGKQHGIKYDQHLQNAFNASDPNVREEYVDLMKQLLEVKFDPNNTTLSEERHRAHMAGLWLTFLKHFVPGLDESRSWDEDTLREWIELFLVNLVQCAKGKAGERIRASTLRRWLVSLIPMIGRYASNKNGHAVGAKMLATGFYVRLRAREKWIVEHFKLNRFPATRGYLSQRDIQAIFECGFASTETYGRQSFIQTHLSFVIVFLTAIRASSFAAGHPKYKEWGHYIKLKDLTINVVEPGVWDVDIKVAHRKGLNEVTDPGYALEFRLGAVKQVHNLVFDGGIMLLAHLLLLDALADIKTVGELFAYKGRYIRIKQSMLDEPLFRERGHRGHTLTDKPASSGNIQGSARALGRKAGIPATKYHDIRRDASNFGIVFGTEGGRRLLGHTEGETVFDRNYSRGTWNFDVTAARLGELDSTLDPKAQLSIMRHRNECMVIDAILNAETRPSKGNTIEEEEALAKHKFIQMLDRSLVETWAELHALLPRWVYLKYESARWALVSIEAAIKASSWYPNVKSEFERLRDRIHELADWRVDVSRQVLKRVRHKTTVELQEEFQAQKEQHNIDDYKEIEEALVWESAATEVAATPEDLQLANLELLSPEIRLQFERPDMMEFIAGHIRQYYTTPEDEQITLQSPDEPAPSATGPDPERDPEVYQAEDIGVFDDSHELPVFSVDFMTTRIIFFIRLVNPAFAYLELMRKFKENGNKHICERCIGWGHLKPAKTPESFETLSKFTRHLAEMHTPWADLRIQMITIDPEVLKCPTDGCTFTAATADDVFEHCLEDCSEKELFQKVNAACKVTRKRDDEDARKARKRARALVDGINLSDRSLETMEILATAPDHELMDLAAKVKFDDLEGLQYRIPLVREMVRLALSVLEANDNVIRHPHALDYLKSISNELITADEERYIQERLEGIDFESIHVEPNWAPDAIDASSVSSEDAL